MDIRNSFKLLTEEQLKNSEILKNYGLQAETTDFARLLGAFVYPYHGNQCGWWIDSSKDNNNKIVINSLYKLEKERVDLELNGIRLVVPYSKIKNLCTKIVKDNSNILEVESSLYYPRNVTDINDLLEQKYQYSALKKTGKNYVFSAKYVKGFCFKNFEFYKVKIPNKTVYYEYEFEGNKYVRVILEHSLGKYLSNGIEIENKKPYWVKVEPIRFIVDEKQDFAITKEIICGGIIFDKYKKEDYYGFNEPVIKKYIRKHLSKDIEVIEKDQIKMIQEQSNKKIMIEEKEYTPSINIDEDIAIQIELSGSKAEVIEILKNLRDMKLIKEKELVKMKLLEKPKPNYTGGHYGYKK